MLPNRRIMMEARIGQSLATNKAATMTRPINAVKNICSLARLIRPPTMTSRRGVFGAVRIGYTMDAIRSRIKTITIGRASQSNP